MPGKSETPFTLIKNLLTDGRAVYCVYFEKDEPTPAGLDVHPAVAYLNLPLNEEEKRRRVRSMSGERSRVQPDGGRPKSKERKNSRPIEVRASRGREREPEDFQEVGSGRPEPPRRAGRATGTQILVGDAAYGLTEPPDGGRRRARARAPSRSTSLAMRDLLESSYTDYSNFKGWHGADENGISGEIPEFAPAAELAGNPNGLAGACPVCLAGDRQTLRG